MKKYCERLITISVMILAAVAAASASSPCPAAPDWNGLDSVGRREAVYDVFGDKKLTDECFPRAVAALHSADGRLLLDSLATVFSARAAKRKFSRELLFALYREERLTRDERLWPRIVDIWISASEQPPNIILASLGDGGSIPIADTLYRALDAAGRIDAHELLRYGRIKSLRGDYGAATSVYCRAIAADRRVEHAALTQMAQFFADADPAEKEAAMAIFEACAFAAQPVDTAFYRNWIADFYGRAGLYEKEIATLVKYDMATASSGRKLADAARSHYSKRRYRHAATAAVAAHGRLEESEKPGIAFMAHQSYVQIGLRDSALVWLRTSGVTSMDARIQAVALSLDVGHTSEAAALIDSLPAGLPKDTLTVRRHIFVGDLDKALAHVTERRVSWSANQRERMLWQARVLIFSGRAAEAAPVLDSIRFVAAWHGTSEVLNYKYRLQKLDDDRHGLDAWGKLEHQIYVGDLTAAISALKRQRLSGEWGEMLVIRLSRRLAAVSRFQEALEVLELVGANKDAGPDFGIRGIPGREDPVERVHGAEYLYFTAEMLHETGRREEARALAQRILREFPGDVFAQKARILLTKI